MKTIRFTASERLGGAYGCSEPGEQSGEYVKAEVARDLHDACYRAAMQWRAYHQLHNEHDIDDENSAEGDLYRSVMESLAKAESTK
jgi:hypothetical protein